MTASGYCTRHQWSKPLSRSKGIRRRNKTGHYPWHILRRCLRCDVMRWTVEPSQKTVTQVTAKVAAPATLSPTPTTETVS